MSAEIRTMNGTEFSDETIARIAHAVRGMSDKTLTKQEAADFLKIKYRTFERRLKRNHYPAKLIHRDGSTILFLESELINYVKGL
jgi:hypothetical protein